MAPDLDTVSAGDANRKLTELLGRAVSVILMFIVGLLVVGLILVPWSHGISLVGVTIVNLSILKNGRAKAIRFSTSTRLCQVLDCQPGDLLTWRKEG